MATYTRAYFPDVANQRKRQQKISVVEQVVDLSTYPARKMPGGVAQETGIPYATNDIIEVIGLRAGTTVLGVDVEVLTKGLPHSEITIGYGSDTDLWGSWSLASTGWKDPLYGVDAAKQYFEPQHFASADTIDVKLVKGMHGRPGTLPGSSEPELGPELITGGAFAADSGWTKGTGWAIAGGVATKTAGVASSLDNTGLTVTAGRYYWCTLDCSTRTAGTLTPVGGTAISAISTNTGKTRQLCRVTTSQTWGLDADATADHVIDNVSLKLLDHNFAKFRVRAYLMEDERTQRSY